MKIKKMLRWLPLFLVVLLVGGVVPSYAIIATGNTYFDITESMPDPFTVDFDVDTDYTDIIGFAVGTETDFGDTATTVGSGWSSYIAYQLSDSWYVRLNEDGDDNGLKDIVLFGAADIGFDLNLVEDGVFNTDTYTKAFVFFVEPQAATHFDINETDFLGLALPASHYVGFRDTDNDGVAELDQLLTGETNVVPVPGAAFLLFSGLAGLAGFVRRKR